MGVIKYILEFGTLVETVRHTILRRTFVLLSSVDFSSVAYLQATFFLRGLACCSLFIRIRLDSLSRRSYLVSKFRVHSSLLRFSAIRSIYRSKVKNHLEYFELDLERNERNNNEFK